MTVTFGVRNDKKVFLDHQVRFYEEIFFPYLEQNTVHAVIHLGDLMDRRKYVNFTTLQRMNEVFMKRLDAMGLPVYFIVGNHDTYYKNSNEVNSLNELFSESNYENFHYYWKEPVELDFDGLKVMLAPWICDDNRERTFQMIRDTDARVLMGHFEIQGFEMDRGTICEHGERADDFSKFLHVFSGHFHHKSHHKNINYLGAQYEMTWADCDDPKGFHIFDTDTMELTFVNNPLSMFHKITYNGTEMSAEDISELDVSALVDTYVKVIVQEKGNPYIYDLFQNKMNQSGAADVKFIEDSVILEQMNLEGIIDEAQDTLTILKNYIGNMDMDEITKKQVENCLRNLYQEALDIV